VWVSKEQRRDRCRRMGDSMRWGPSIEARRREEERGWAVGRSCGRGQDHIHSPPRDRGQCVFVTADSLSSREAAEQGGRQSAKANGANGWWQWMLFFVCFLLDRTG
jgi:hypothetical protein